MVWFSVFACLILVDFFFQAEDGIRDLVRSRGLGDVYKRQSLYNGRMGFYNKIWHTLLDEKKSTFTWTDGHPKLSLIHI